jgi:hypothetical protein
MRRGLLILAGLVALLALVLSDTAAGGSAKQRGQGPAVQVGQLR